MSFFSLLTHDTDVFALICQNENLLADKTELLCDLIIQAFPYDLSYTKAKYDPCQHLV